MNHELTPEQIPVAGGENGCSPVKSNQVKPNKFLDPPVALAPKMVAQLSAADMSVPSSDSQRPVSYRDVLLGQPPSGKSPHEFSEHSLIIKISGTKEYD